MLLLQKLYTGIQTGSNASAGVILVFGSVLGVLFGIMAIVIAISVILCLIKKGICHVQCHV